jgi:hypothetical protein
MITSSQPDAKATTSSARRIFSASFSNAFIATKSCCGATG